MRAWVGSLLVFAWLAGAARPAHADDNPWSAGVSEEHKAKANKLLDEGNALFLEKNFREALDRYREAIAVWDHPAIRFNIVRCLVQLDRPVEALDNLELALKYGSAPLQDAVYTEALAYEKMLVKQVANVTVECKQPKVELALDGQPLPACPMVDKRRILPGRHQLVGTREGFNAKTIEVTAIGGDSQRFSVELSPVVATITTDYSRRWATWKPWAVFGSGLAFAAIGGVFEVRAFGHMRDYDNLIATKCPDGCIGALPSTHDKRTAEIENAIGIAGMAVGVAGVVVGSVMLYANRKPVRSSREIAVAPLAGGALVVVGDRW